MDQPDKLSNQQSNTEQVVRDIARQLQETNPEAIEQLGLIIHRLGVEKAQEFLQETLKTEAESGLLVRDGSRRRTPGGVYFRLVRGKVSCKDRWAIWSHLAPKPKPHPSPLFERAGRIVEKEDVVLTSMRDRKRPRCQKGCHRYRPTRLPTLSLLPESSGRKWPGLSKTRRMR